MPSLFLNLAAFWFMFLIPLVVLLYFLKLKREELVFPSTMLWQRTLEDLRVNSPFQRIKKNLLLFLQLLLLFLAILALARPFWVKRSHLGKNVVVLLDHSASMQATDENGKSRFDKAKENVLKMIDDLSENDRMMIIAFAQTAVIRQPFTSLKSLLKDSLNSIDPIDAETRISEALTIANAMVQQVSQPSIFVVTDGAIPLLDEILAKMEFSSRDEGKGKKTILPHFLLQGKRGDNVAILAMEIRQDPGRGCQAFVRVQNFGEEPAKGYLELWVNGSPLEEDIRMVELGPGDVNGILFQNLLFTGGTIEAKLTVTEGKDYLAVDNRAFFALSPRQKNKICLVTQGNFFLRKVLLPHDPEIAVVTLSQFLQMQQGPSPVRFDMVVFDQCAPSSRLPDGGYLFINAIPFLPGLQSYGEIKQDKHNTLSVIDQNDFHPTMRFVNMRRLSLGQALKIDWPENGVPLVEVKNNAVLFAFTKQNACYVVVAFDLFQSDWPLRLSFPIFVTNCLNWFVDSQFSTNVKVGDPFRIRPPDEQTSSAQLVLPSGTSVPLSFSKGRTSTSDTALAGFYRIVFPKSTTVLSANLFSAGESEIRPKEKITIGKEEVGSRQLQPINRELWSPLLLGVFFLLMLEWYLYHRRSLTFWRYRPFEIARGRRPPNAS